MKNAYKVLVKKSEGEDHSEDLSVDGIRMDLRKIEWESKD